MFPPQWDHGARVAPVSRVSLTFRCRAIDLLRGVEAFLPCSSSDAAGISFAGAG